MTAEPLPKELVFVDTNILVYSYDRSAGDKHTAAVQIMEHLWGNKSGCMSIQVLQEFIVNTTRKIAYPLDTKIVKEIISDLAYWRVHIPDVTDLLQAIDIQQAYQVSFWDAMILQSAARLGCSQLLSEDLSDGQIIGAVKVINPFRHKA